MSILETARKYVNGEEILREWVGSGAVPVDAELAQKRADICLQCPKNKPWVATDAIATAIKLVVWLKNKMQLRVKGEKKLKTCHACLCSLRTKVWIPIERIRPSAEERPDFDENCWLLKE